MMKKKLEIDIMFSFGLAYQTLGFMKNKIDLYYLSIIDFVTLKNDLLNSSNNLEDINQNWKDEFRSNCFFLEEIYAVNSELHNGRKYGIKDLEDIASTIAFLKKMVDELIASFYDLDIENINSATQLENSWVMCPNCFEAWEEKTSRKNIFCENCKRVLKNPLFKRKS